MREGHARFTVVGVRFVDWNPRWRRSGACRGPRERSVAMPSHSNLGNVSGSLSSRLSGSLAHWTKSQRSFAHILPSTQTSQSTTDGFLSRQSSVP